MKKLGLSSLIVFYLLTNLSCNSMKKADLIIKNATVYTVDSNFTVANSFAVKDGKFLAVGTNESIANQYDADSVIDVGGKPVYPGFIDGHCHFYYYGMNKLRYADLVGTNSFSEILDVIEEHRQKHEGDWLLGRGWDQNDWTQKDFPDNKVLNQRYPETPVILTRIDGHAVLANDVAIKKAGIRKANIPKGEALYENGTFSGVFLEGTADKIRDAIPEPDEQGKKDALMTAQNDCFAVGLTSVVDAGLEKPVIDVIDSLNKTGELKMGMDVMLTPNKENIEAFIEKGHYKTDRLHIHSIKLFADGALGSRGACLLEPYSDAPANYGILIKEPDYYRNLFELAYKNDYQVNTHAIGDSAVRFLLNEYGKFLETNNDRRWRIEHAQIVHPDDFAKFGQYNIIPSVQATHATSDMYWADERIGQERLKGSYALKELLQENGWLVNGTDFPIENINPVYTFFASVIRKDLEGYPEEGFQMENALTRKQALRSMTIWAAKGSFEEKEKGSIEPGKNADFVILDRDIMKVGEDDLAGAEVNKTFVNGEKVYQK